MKTLGSIVCLGLGALVVQLATTQNANAGPFIDHNYNHYNNYNQSCHRVVVRDGWYGHVTYRTVCNNDRWYNNRPISRWWFKNNHRDNWRYDRDHDRNRDHDRDRDHWNHRDHDGIRIDGNGIRIRF